MTRTQAATTPCVIAIGNALRGDDAAGPEVARRLLERGYPSARVRVHRDDVTGLVDLLRDEVDVVLVDATRTGAEPGTIVRLDCSAAALPADVAQASSHGLGLAEAVELCRALGALPARVIVIGIEGACFDHGAALAPAVEAAIDRVVATLLSAHEESTHA